jgi:hypothetical protein
MKWVLGAVSLGVKQQGREAEHSSSDADVELYLHSTVCLHEIKHKDNFTFSSCFIINLET